MTLKVGDYVRALIDPLTGRVKGWRTPAEENQVMSDEFPTREDLALPGAAAGIGFRQADSGALDRSAESKLRDVVSDADYATLQAAIDAAAAQKKHLEIAGQWTSLTSTLNVPSNISIFIRAGALVSTATPDLTLFDINSRTNAHIYGFGKLSQTGTPGTTYRGCAGIRIRGTSSNCTVSGWLEFDGFSAFGVQITDTANNCKVIGNYFHDWRGSVGDSAAVMIERDTFDNVVDGARCVATGYLGCAIFDEGGAGTYNPRGNKIRNCNIRDTVAYGVMLYVGRAGNSRNEITGNDVAGVTGTAPGGFYGMGIYCVGSGLGGCKILNNTVRDCCKSQTSTANGMGAITVGGAVAGYTRPMVAGNDIADMTQGCGIDLVSNAGGVVVGPNTVRIPAGNNGTGPGGATLIGHALRILNCSNIALSPGDYQNASSGGVGNGNAILVQSTGATYRRLTLNLGLCNTAVSTVVAIAGAANTLHGSICGGDVSGAGNVANGIQAAGWNGPITGVQVNIGTSGAALDALVLSSCNANVSACELNTTGTSSVSIGGASTGIFDRSNIVSGNVNNGASGFRVEVLSAGIPTAGTFQVGDLAVNRNASATGNTPAWSRKTAGFGHVLNTDWAPHPALL